MAKISASQISQYIFLLLYLRHVKKETVFVLGVKQECQTCHYNHYNLYFALKCFLLLATSLIYIINDWLCGNPAIYS